MVTYQNTDKNAIRVLLQASYDYIIHASKLPKISLVILLNTTENTIKILLTILLYPTCNTTNNVTNHNTT